MNPNCPDGIMDRELDAHRPRGMRRAVCVDGPLSEMKDEVKGT
jgi:hypothetical protein